MNSDAGEWSARELLTGILQCIGTSGLLILYRPDLAKSAMWWSPATWQLLGYEPSELIPSFETLESLLHPEDRDAWSRRVRTSEPGFVGDGKCGYRLRRKDGEYVWACSFASASRLQDTGPVAHVDVLRIVDRDEMLERTARKLSESALSTVLNEIGYPVVLMSAEGIIKQANEAAARFAGGSAAAERFCPFLHRDDGELLFTGFLEDVIRLAQPASRELQRFDRWWHVHLVPIRDELQRVARILMLAQDVTSIKAEQVAQLERQRALTRTLVREVHHRIKNHLQGLVGLMRRLSHSGLTGEDLVASAIVQIQSIAAMHGILAKSGKSAIDLGSLMTEIIAAHRATTPIPVSLIVEPNCRAPFELPEDDSVPLALAVGELLTNAIKHTEPSAGAKVEGILSTYGDGVELTISNSPAQLPQGFVLSEWAFASSGLGLVRALLPTEWTELTLEQQGSAVVAKLRMRATTAGDVPKAPGPDDGKEVSPAR